MQNTEPTESPLYGEEHARGTRLAERAIRVAIACSIFGALAKLSAGVLTGSMAMISSAVDSLGDLFVSVANLFVVRYGDQPPDEDHNYGHARIEGLGAMFEGGFIFGGGIFTMYESIHRAAIGEHPHSSALGIAVMVPVLGATLGTVVYLRKIARSTGSLVVKSDALHYMTDVWVNVGVLVSLLLVRLTGRPIVDTVISIGIALFMLYSSVGVVREGFDAIMERSLDRDVVGRIAALLRGHSAVDSFHDLKTRRGKIPHVDFHIVVRPSTTVEDVHDLFLDLEREICAIAGRTTKVLMHADPAAAQSR